MKSGNLPALSEIEEAEAKIRRYFPPTPIEYSRSISNLLGRETYLKLETALPIHVFKIRGALNKFLSLPDAELKKGVVTASSGNHGLAIAYASKLFGASATICVPTNANPQKVKAIEEQGAEIVKFGSGYDEAVDHALALSREKNLKFIHAFNDRQIIAGQGTCGFEITRQVPDTEAVAVAIGGGGLISGIAIAIKGTMPACRVYGAETVSIPSMYESIQRGERTHIVPKPTIADGMQAAVPGELTFEAVRNYVDKIGLVDDQQLEDAIFDLLSFARILAEPAGASPLAAVKGPLRREPGKKIVLVISGGNISMELLAAILRKRVKGSLENP